MTLSAKPALAYNGDTMWVSDSSWRSSLAALYIGESDGFAVRELQGDLEIWENGPNGYAVVDSALRVVLESSPTSTSPFYGVSGGSLYYLGLGGYVAAMPSRPAVDVMSGQSVEIPDLAPYAADAAALIQDTAVAQPSNALQPSLAPSSVAPPPAGSITKRVTSYGYITGSRVYPNSTGVCGWVAGSILVRYWHARYSSRGLLPSAYRSGTNMTSSPNFATYLRNGRSLSTWAPDLVAQLAWNASRQGVSVETYYNWFTTGVESSINNNRPVLLFGNYPKTSGSGKSNHAVVGYGLVNGGGYVVHYGYSGCTNIHLNAGLTGTNTKFWLK